MCQVRAAQRGNRVRWTSQVWWAQTACLQNARGQQHGSIVVSLDIEHPAGAQMVLTLKMISAAVCYHDGLKPAEVVLTHLVASWVACTVLL